MLGYSTMDSGNSKMRTVTFVLSNVSYYMHWVWPYDFRPLDVTTDLPKAGTPTEHKHCFKDSGHYW